MLGAKGGQLVYVDGALAGTLASVTKSTLTWGDSMHAGLGHYAFSSPITYLAGAMDEMRVWTLERSAAEIAADYNADLAAVAGGDGGGDPTINGSIEDANH